MKKLLQILAIILFSCLALAGIVQAKGLYTINSPEVESIASHLAMEGHSEHDIATCTTKQRYFTEITEMLNDGLAEQDILDHYESMYGEQGFREPKRSGFSLLAWTTPFLVIGAGAVFLLTRMKKQTVAEVPVKVPDTERSIPVSSTEDDELRRMFEEEKRKRF